MKRILDQRPSSPMDYGHDQQEDGPGDGGVRDMAPGQVPAGGAGVGEQAGRALPPMVFPGPLAFQPAPVMLPAPDALVSPAAPASPSALVDARERRDSDQIRLFIRALATDDAGVASMKKGAILLFAAHLGHLGLVEALLAAGAKVNFADLTYGKSALNTAAERGHVEFVSRLLKHPEIECDKLDACGYSALMISVMNNHPDVVNCLLAAGAQVNLANPTNGNTALIIAATNGYGDSVKRLLAQTGIKRDMRDTSGHNALMWAARKNHLDVVNCLLDAGAKVNLVNPTNGSTALIIAAYKGHVDVVRRLLAQPGIELNISDADGDSALMCAVKKNRPDAMDCLLAARVQFNLPYILHEAVSHHHAGIVEVLFRRGVQRSDLPADLSPSTMSFVAAIEDLAAELNASAPALPGPEQAKAFFEELTDKLAGDHLSDESMLRWLQGKGLRRAGAVELLAVLAGEQAPWKIPDASRQQKMLYCLGAISRLPALGGAGKVRKLYGDAGISAAAVERLGGAANDQLDHMASLAAAMLAGMGSEMLGALVDGCMARTNTGGEVNVAEFTASLIGQGYCPPVAQAIVRSWQDSMSVWGKLQMPASANGTAGQLMKLLKDRMAEHAPALFAQTLLHALASHEPVRQLSAMQENSHDEVLHALFQIQCDQLRQLCEQLLAPPPSGTPGASDGADATQTGS